jgi:hypothetical protein
MLVAGTRFVTSPVGETSAKTLFEDQRVALSSFNEIDRCIGQSALEVAREFFTTLGLVIGKAGRRRWRRRS